jgi:hypothetical protein
VHSGPTTEATSRSAAPRLVADGDRVVLAHHLAEIARRRQVVVQPAVGHQEHLAARDLAVDDAGDIHARLADQVAAQFDHDAGLRQVVRRTGAQRARLAPMGARSSRCSPGKYGMPKPPPRLRKRTGAAPSPPAAAPARSSCSAPRRWPRRAGSASRQTGGSPRTAALGRDAAKHLGHLLDVDAELLGPAAHLHARALELEVGVDAHGHPRRQPSSCEAAPARQFAQDSTLTSTRRPPPGAARGRACRGRQS